MAAVKPATVRVLHRAIDSADDDSTQQRRSTPGSQGLSLEELKAANESLKQRLEQVKASSAAEKKRLMDDLRLERAGRERAEELLVRQAKELEACAAGKARLEEAFSRSVSELRYSRAEHTQSKQTIQQLLREVMLLRDTISRNQQGSAGGKGTDGGGGSPTAAASSKHMSKGQMRGELLQLRAKMAAEEARRLELEAEKERAEVCQEMISRQTAKLLDDRAALLSDLSSKDDVVRELQAAVDHVQHQLHIALNDRNLLLEQLRAIAGDAAAPELAALTAAMATGFSQDLDELEAFAHGGFDSEVQHSPRVDADTAADAAEGCVQSVSSPGGLGGKQQAGLQQPDVRLLMPEDGAGDGVQHDAVAHLGHLAAAVKADVVSGAAATAAAGGH